MAWERRGDKQVYYRSRRINGQVKKIYLGSGPRAQIASEHDRLQQEEKSREQATRKLIEALDSQTDTLNQTTKTLVKAHLLLAGYHQHHRGEWRKRRRQIITQQEGGSMITTLTVQETPSIDDLEPLIQKAMTGDEASLIAIRTFFDQTPTIWQEAFNITKKVETAWIQLITGKDLLTREALERQVATLKMTLQAEFSSPLESLVIESISTCYLAYKQAELAAATQLQRNNGIGLTQIQQNHLTACQKRHLLAIRELAKMRQLLAPQTKNILNIAQNQQVNIA